MESSRKQHQASEEYDEPVLLQFYIRNACALGGSALYRTDFEESRGTYKAASTGDFSSFFKSLSSHTFNMVTKESRIAIIGGGVFGLSTALWLARDGYTDITIFDRCAFDKNFYDPSNGCDGASADLNKIFRMSYGEKIK